MHLFAEIPTPYLWDGAGNLIPMQGKTHDFLGNSSWVEVGNS